MKQVGTAIYMYTQDYDETYPREDVQLVPPAKSPLNPAATSTFALRLNHYKWEAWVLPYIKNVQVFFCPSRTRDMTAWNTNGEIRNGYALNTAITGATNGTGGNPELRNSFLGGTLAGLDTPAESFILQELKNQVGYTYANTTSGTVLYPLATRESWDKYLRPGGVIDKISAPHSDGFTFAFCDGHAKWMNVSTFLGKCPTAAQYGGVPVVDSTRSAMYTTARRPNGHTPGRCGACAKPVCKYTAIGINPCLLCEYRVHRDAVLALLCLL